MPDLREAAGGLTTKTETLPLMSTRDASERPREVRCAALRGAGTPSHHLTISRRAEKRRFSPFAFSTQERRAATLYDAFWRGPQREEVVTIPVEELDRYLTAEQLAEVKRLSYANLIKDNGLSAEVVKV